MPDHWRSYRCRLDRVERLAAARLDEDSNDVYEFALDPPLDDGDLEVFRRVLRDNGINPEDAVGDNGIPILCGDRDHDFAVLRAISAVRRYRIAACG